MNSAGAKVTPIRRGRHTRHSAKNSPVIQGGNALEPTSSAMTVRVRDNQFLAIDGPFAETKEQLAGFYLVEAKDAREAAGMAAKIPAARYGSIEVRPVMRFS